MTTKKAQKNQPKKRERKNPPKRSDHSQLQTTIPNDLLKFVDEIAASGSDQFPRRLTKRGNSGRAAVVTGILEGVRRLELNFDRVSSAEEIAAIITATKR